MAAMLEQALQLAVLVEQEFVKLKILAPICSTGVGDDGICCPFPVVVVLFFYMTLSKMMTLFSSAPGDMELRDLMSGAMYSK